MAREKVAKEKKTRPASKPFREMTPKEKTKRILGIVGSVFQLLLVVVALMMSVIVIVYTYDREANELPSMFGVSFLTVQSESMDYDTERAIAYYQGEGAQFADTAKFKKHDLIIVKEWKSGESDALKVGDVVTFYDSSIPVKNNNGENIGWFNTHRIVEILDNGNIITRGDNNPAPDQEMAQSRVIAVWGGSKISGWGKIIDWVKDSTHFLLVIVLPLALLFIFNVFMFIRELVKHNVDKNSKNLAAEKAAAVEAAKQAAIQEYLAEQAKLQREKDEQAKSEEGAEPTADESTDKD